MWAGTAGGLRKEVEAEVKMTHGMYVAESLKVQGHLIFFDFKAAALIEADIVVSAIQDHLVAALFPRQIHETEDNPFAQLHSSSLLIHYDVLNVCTHATPANKFGLKQHSPCPDHNTLFVHCDKGLSHALATLLLHQLGKSLWSDGGGFGELRVNGEQAIFPVDWGYRSDLDVITSHGDL